MSRRSLSKKTRFDVFKRDGFQCQYCGQQPPVVVLEVDHITAVARGGTNEVDNLITSCFDCNRGKGAGDLSTAPATLAQKTEVLREKEEQLAAFNKLLASKRRRETKLINEIEAVFSMEFDGYAFTDKFRESIRHNFIPSLTQEQLFMAIYRACAKCRGRPNDATKYFCGVCWKLIRDGER